METHETELKIQVPEGYEIDEENSTFKCIKFKPIKKYLTYKDICDKLFIVGKIGHYISDSGEVEEGVVTNYEADKNNATNREQLERLLALNQLLNIAEYYNKMHSNATNHYTIVYCKQNKTYNVVYIDDIYVYGIKVFFNNEMDARAVINNPNFREILNTIYKN